jgi:TetR/AcrR family transcriptional repressor of mexJK operon
MAGRKGALILDTARQMFLERGYDATSLDDVAAASGVSKTTVYNNFKDKEGLFSAVVLAVTERAEQIISELSATLGGDEPIAGRLTAVARALAYGVLNPAVVQLRRLAIAEALRFPGIVTAYWERAPARTLALLTESFTQLAARGELDIDDPAAAAAIFAYAVLGLYQDQALLQPDRPLARADLDQHVGQVVAAFLRAYAVTRPENPEWRGLRKAPGSGRPPARADRAGSGG